MQEYSDELLFYARESMNIDDYNRLLTTMESDSKLSLDVHKQFLGSIVDKIQKILSVPKLKDQVISKSIAATNGDITKVKDIQVTLDVLNTLKKSHDGRQKKNAEMLLRYYNQIKSHKKEYMKAYAIMKRGSTYEATMANLLYNGYILSVQALVAGTSVTLSKIHDPKSKNPYIDSSVLKTVEQSLKQFEDGTVRKAVNALSKGMKNMNEAVEVAALVIIGGIMAFITLCLSIRIFVYYFYYTRMQLADYFEQQSHFLNIHKSEVKRNSEITAREKDSVLSAQKAWADRFMRLSEMIQDDEIAAAKKTSSVVKKDNKEVIQTPTNVINQPNTGMDFF